MIRQTLIHCSHWMSRHWRLSGVAAAAVLLMAIGIVFWPQEPEDKVVQEVETVLAKQDPSLVEAAGGSGDGRILTVLIPYDRTRFFIEKGEPRGFEYELVQEFVQQFNEDRPANSEPMHAIFAPVPFAQLIDLLAQGKGDIAAGGLTVTPERQEILRFSESYMSGVRELVVTHKGMELGGSLESLSGKRIVVVRGSSYAGHLAQLNKGFRDQGLDEIEIIEAPVSIMSEDLLELVHSGAIGMTVVDEHIAELWQGVLDGISVTSIAISQGNEIAWALSPSLDHALAQSINRFLAKAKRGTLLGNVLFNRYFEATEWIKNPLGPEAIAEISRYRPIFSKYADEEGLDWKLIAAVAFQESGFDPYAESAAGARGLMQVLPSTAAELGFADLSQPEAQIAAGTRYLASLIRTLRQEQIEEVQAVNLALAAYNAGPRRLAELRKTASGELGLDPNSWFFNVERAAARDVGLETVRYVANVNKYRLAYELGETILSARAADREALD